MTNILLPTDFSNNSWNAIVYALKLYAHETCTFYLLNATQLKTSRISSFSNKLLTTMRENAKNDLLKLTEQIEKPNENENHKFEAILSLESLEDAIETAIEKHAIDLVIMGTKGATGAKSILFGSNATTIFKKVKKCPVLAIPANYEFVTPKQIAFPTDFNRYCDAKELHNLKKIADLYKATIRVVHINEKDKLTDEQEKNFTTLRQYLKNHVHSFHWIPTYANKTTEINDCIEELEIDILVMVYYTHSFLESITHEPVIKKIGFQLKIPLMVIPE